jgi:hypothetical protein
MQDALKSAGLSLAAPSRKDTPGDNSNAGNFEKPGTLVANVVQDMVQDAIKGASTKKRNSSSAMMRGFLAEISEALAEVS